MPFGWAVLGAAVVGAAGSVAAGSEQASGQKQAAQTQAGELTSIQQLENPLTRRHRRLHLLDARPGRRRETVPAREPGGIVVGEKSLAVRLPPDQYFQRQLEADRIGHLHQRRA